MTLTTLEIKPIKNSPIVKTEIQRLVMRTRKHTSYRDFAKSLSSVSAPLLTFKSQSIWGWESGLHIPKLDRLKLFLHVLDGKDCWQHDFVVGLVELIDTSTDD